MTKLHPYQKEGVQLIEDFDGRCLLADEMGLGKTLQSLKWCYWHPEARPIIVICRATVKYNWSIECKKHFGWQATILEGEKPRVLRNMLVADKIYIINYDILQYWVKYLCDLDPEVIILDEMQALGNLKTKRTKATRELCRKAFHVIGLSGTPFNHVAQLFPFLNICRPDVFDSWGEYAWRHCQPEKKFGKWQFKGAKNLKTLRKKLLATVMIRRLKKDVLPQIPPKTRIIYPLKIDNRKEYEQAEKDFKGWLRQYFRGDKKKLNKSLRAERLVRFGYLKRLAAKGKIKSIYDWVDGYFDENEGEKLILFGIHKFMIGALKERYRDISVVIDGSVTGKARQTAIDIFTHKERCKLMIGNSLAAGFGWNGTVANQVGFPELPWVPAEVNQCIDRIHRIGQGRPCFANFLIAHNTIESKLCDILQRRQNVFDEVMDGGEGEDLSLFDELEEALMRGDK